MNSIHRIFIFLKRSFIARKMGVSFKGTTAFSVPKSFKIGSRSFSYDTPHDIGNAHDFINLALDDDYGLGCLSDSPKTILDIGANCGLFSLLATQRFPEAMIHAYEPNPRIYPFAARNFERTSIQSFQVGIGSEAGRAELLDSQESTLAQTVLSPLGTIEIRSLEEAIARLSDEGIDLLKMDCEGAEWEIFKNPTPFKKIKRIRMEYHLLNGKTVEDFTQIVMGLGYKIERLIKNQGFGLAWLIRTGN